MVKRPSSPGKTKASKSVPEKPKKQPKSFSKIEKKLQRANQILDGAKTRPSAVELPKAKKVTGGRTNYHIYTDSEFDDSEDEDSSDQESSDPQIDSKDVFQRDARVTTILNRGLKSSRPHNSKDKKGNINKRQAAKLKNNKLNWYSKQE